jgi:hypothetical protein
LPRHRTIPSNRSKAIALIAAGAFSVAGAATAAAATWTRAPGQAPAGTAQAAAQATAQATAQAAAASAGPAITGQPASPPSFSPPSVSLAVRAFQIHATQAGDAAARWQDARQRAERQAEAAQAAALAAQSQAEQPQQAAAAVTAAAYTAASGTPEQIAKAMLSSFGWSSSQFSCLYPLWEHESGWSITAANADGAYGIPQALPGAKMASAGPDWQTDAATQIRWGLEYIKGLYGSPCGAWDHEQATGWY